MIKKIKNIIVRDKFYIIALLVMVVVFNIKLPYYVNAPGGVIDITDRIEYDDYNPSGTFNLLYVSEYEGKLPLVLLSFIMKDWDLEKKEDVQIEDESDKEIYQRNRIMLEDSIQNASIVAYNYAGKKVTINSKKNIVLAVTEDNNLKIGDEILKVDNKEVEDINSLKENIESKEKGQEITLEVIRNDKKIKVKSKISDENTLGVIVNTLYDYELDPDIKINFKKRESGSSGGLMLALSIYNAVSDNDIIKERNIAGTGTIDINGNVGEIDGIKYKVLGAIKNDIDILLVPSSNYKDAISTCKKNNCDIDIVKVDTFEEAVNYLS